jgi:hypothetical protein
MVQGVAEHTIQVNLEFVILWEQDIQPFSFKVIKINQPIKGLTT